MEVSRGGGPHKGPFTSCSPQLHLLLPSPPGLLSSISSSLPLLLSSAPPPPPFHQGESHAPGLQVICTRGYINTTDHWKEPVIEQNNEAEF